MLEGVWEAEVWVLLGVLVEVLGVRARCVAVESRSSHTASSVLLAGRSVGFPAREQLGDRVDGAGRASLVPSPIHLSPQAEPEWSLLCPPTPRGRLRFSHLLLLPASCPRLPLPTRLGPSASSLGPGPAGLLVAGGEVSRGAGGTVCRDRMGCLSLGTLHPFLPLPTLPGDPRLTRSQPVYVPGLGSWPAAADGVACGRALLLHLASASWGTTVLGLSHVPRGPCARAERPHLSPRALHNSQASLPILPQSQCPPSTHGGNTACRAGRAGS